MLWIFRSQLLITGERVLIGLCNGYTLWIDGIITLIWYSNRIEREP